jgi:hypothetical protein
MKNLITVLLLIASLSVKGQIQFDESNYEYQLIDSCNGNKPDLFAKAMSFFATYYKSAANVVQYSDINAGKIIGKAVISNAQNGLTGTFQCTCYINYTITVDIKDGKYRCVVNDLSHKSCNSAASGGLLSNDKPDGGLSGIGKRNWRTIKEHSDQEVRALLLSLKKEMHSNSSDF